MNEAAVEVGGVGPKKEESASRAFLERRAVRRLHLQILAIVLVYACLAGFRLGFADLGIDEGRYGIVGLNILRGHHQLAILSEDPLGNAGTKPFMYGLALSGSMLLFGENEFALRFVNVVALACTGLVLYSLVSLCCGQERLALLTLLFFLLDPWTIRYARTVMPEPFVVLWGSLAMLGAAKFLDRPAWAWAFISGLALGMAFLSKLWLFFPFAAGCSLLWASGLWAGSQRRACLTGACLATVAFALTAASHLLLVWAWTPDDLLRWKQVYFVESFSSRVAGAGHDPALWFRPWWFYLAGAFRAAFFGLPLVLPGACALFKERKRVPIALALALLSPIAILSVFRVKQTSYAYPIFPALVILLAYGWVGFGRFPAKAALAATILSIVASILLYRAGVLELRELMIINLLYLGYGAVALSSGSRTMTRLLFASIAVAMVAADMIVIRDSMSHRTYYREIARYLIPRLEQYRPQQVAFEAPEYASLEFYTFHSGRYWDTYYTHQTSAEFARQLETGRLAFYVVDPGGTLYGGKIEPVKLDALRHYSLDITPSIKRLTAGRAAVEVFVGAPDHNGQTRTRFERGPERR